jgi:hypothetical protein
MADRKVRNVFRVINLMESNIQTMKAWSSYDEKVLVKTCYVYKLDEKSNKKRWVLNKTPIEIEDVPKTIDAVYEFLTAFKKYLQDGDYTKSANNLQLVRWKLSGMSDFDIQEEFKITNSAYKMRVKRVSREVYHAAFNRKSFPEEVIWCESVDVIKKATLSLKKAKLNLGLGEIFPLATLSAINEKIKDFKPDGRAGTDDEFNYAFRFVSLYSKETFEYYLNGVSQTVLSSIMSQLRRHKVSSVSYAFNLVRSNPDKVINLSSDEFSLFIEKNKRGYVNRADFDKLTIDGADLILGDDANTSVKNDFNIPDDLYAVITRYLSSYEKAVHSGVTKFDNYNYDGIHKATGNTVEETKKFFEFFTVEGFRNKLINLNPYDVKNYIENH